MLRPGAQATLRALACFGMTIGHIVDEDLGEAYELPVLQEYSFEQLRLATAGFVVDNTISEHGEKAPNIVHKGKLDMQRHITVKCFNCSAWLDLRQFLIVVLKTKTANAARQVEPPSPASMISLLRVCEIGLPSPAESLLAFGGAMAAGQRRTSQSM